MSDHAIEAAIESALNLPRPEDAIESVKTIVRSELERMDPDVEIRDTSYFNHTFAPDFVLTWRSGKRESSRDLFLRSSLLASTEIDDFAALGRKATDASTAPAVLALKTSADPEVRQIAHEEVSAAPEVLLTDVGAWDDLTSSMGDVASPVQTLLERNLVRGGRGLILNEIASELISVAQPTDSGIDSDRLDALVMANFVPEAAVRIRRAAQLVDLAFAEQLDLLDADLGERAEALGGTLSESELRLLLPYLLTAEGVTDDVRFWRHVGGMISLSQIEEMTSHLANLDLTRLVVPNIYGWTATRSSVAFYVSDDDLADIEESDGLTQDETTHVDSQDLPESPSVEDSVDDVAGAGGTEPSTPRGQASDGATQEELDPVGRWHIRARMLSTVVGSLRVFVTADARRLKARDDASPARWEDLSERLTEFNLRTVALDGLQRKVSVTAETDAGVLADVTAIQTSIDDEFHVPAVTVKTEGDVAMDVNFVHAQVTGSKVPVGDLVRAAFLLLGHRQDVDRSVLDLVAPIADSG